MATSWAAAQEPVTGLILVGSYAYDRPRMASDVDLVVLTSVPGFYLDDLNWIDALYPRARLVRRKSWGPLTELRVRRRDGLQVEVGINRPEWAQAPLDPGTARVLSDGCRVLYDAEGLLGTALGALAPISPLRIDPAR